jgi:UPF0059 membrane protein CK3_01620
MSFIELLILAIGLAMDAFAISICKGLSFGKLKLKHYLIVGAYFGGFQFGMTVAGYYIGINFSSFIEAFDHWVVFGLLMLIGLNMIRESLDKNDDEINDKLDVKTMVLLAIASSIDALAVGVSFAFIHVEIFYTAAVIGIVAFVLSVLGVKIGSIFGAKYKRRAEMIGGIVLCLMGVKVLLSDLGLIPF